MNKTYTAEEMMEKLGIAEHTLYTWIRDAMPESMKPGKALHEKLGRATYFYTDKDLDNLLQIKKLRQERFTYEAIKLKLMAPSLGKEYSYTNTPGETETVKEFKSDRTLKIMELGISAITLLITLTILIKIVAVGF